MVTIHTNCNNDHGSVISVTKVINAGSTGGLLAAGSGCQSAKVADESSILTEAIFASIGPQPNSPRVGSAGSPRLSRIPTV